MQQSVVLPCGFSFTSNAGKAKADGAEVEIAAKVGKGVTFTAGLGYVNARIVDQTNTGAGGQLQGVSKWTSNSRVQFIHPIFKQWEFG